MRSISKQELLNKIRLQNPWWREPHLIEESKQIFKHRAYFDLFYPHVEQLEPVRALILMGPRRVGKTVMLYQAIQRLLESCKSPNSLCYIDFQVPVYNGRSLDELLRLGMEAANFSGKETFYVFFDEIQYLPEWEVHLKTAVDEYGDRVKFIASGSAAAALRLKSVESGAGRFTDFLLPPITFFEFLDLLNLSLISAEFDENEETTFINWDDINQVNSTFIEYMNIGGYPEAIFSNVVRADPARYIGSDIIEKVLLKDLPSLYGIHDVQELNSLFTMLAYNTAGEISLDALASKSGVAKKTLKRYIEYLESAFLIKVLHRVDRSAKRFKRANFFKVYLTNPCMHSALFGPSKDGDEGLGSLVETAVFSQWFHSIHTPLYYARWNKGEGEVDLVHLSSKDMKPTWATEVKWTDRASKDSKELSSMRKFLTTNPHCDAICTTKTMSSEIIIDGKKIQLFPTSAYCYYVGWMIVRKKKEGLIPVSFHGSPSS